MTTSDDAARARARATLIRLALEEDVGGGDRTTLWTVPGSRHSESVVVSKAPLVVAGTDCVRDVYRAVDPGVEVEVVTPDATRVDAGRVLIRLRGPARSLLTGERTALNFLARLSGVATLTRAFVERVAGTGARIVDTRKTAPGWRLLEKAAVRAGGGENHRMGLYDMVLVKENHIAAAGGIGAALERVAQENREGLPVEVEVTSLAELDEALSAGVDRILLDNMPLELLRKAVERARTQVPCPELEASGNMTLATVRSVAEAGVDLISVGALTHSAPAVDLSMLVDDGA